MHFRFNLFPVIAILALFMLLPGCVTLRSIKSVEGQAIVQPAKHVQAGESTLAEILSTLGAPDHIAALEGMDVLVYQKAYYRENTVSLGLPISEILWPNIDISVYGALVRYDRLTLFFTPDGVLRDTVFEQNSTRSYLEAFFDDQ